MIVQSIRSFQKHISIGSMSNGLVSWLFAVTGPLLIVLQAAAQGHLSPTETTSWVFAIYTISGLVTIYHALRFRQPIGYAFSIPGAVLVGASLAHHTFPQVVGAYVISGVIIFLLGVSGVVKKVMSVLPMPVMMGMVSGVLLPFGVGLFHAVLDNPLVNGIPLVVFMLISFFPSVAKRFPAILGAIIATSILLGLSHSIHTAGLTFSVAVPHVYTPAWNVSAMGELVVPLVLTVIAIQNAQGIAVLKSSEYEPPINVLTSWSGIASIVNAFFGAHTSCVAGPVTALLSGSESGPKPARYTAAVFMGIFSIVFGLFAPLAASIPNIMPASTIQMLGGIAMINVLTDSLQMSFSTRFKKSALFSFLITISGISFLHVGAPFWGLVGGTCTSFLLERDDYKKESEEKI